MSNYIQSSPWGAQVDDLGAVFGRLMLNMAQMRAQQDLASQQQAYNQQRLGLEREKMAGEAPLIKAQTEAQTAGAALDRAKTGDLTNQWGNAQDAGRAFFAQALAPVGYNPLTGGNLQDTPEVREALARAFRGQALGTSAAMNPTAAASLLRELELNKDTALYDPTAGRVVAKGPVSPERPYTLGPGDQAFMPGQEKPFASNTNPRFGNRDEMRDYSALLGNLAPLILAGSKENAFGDPSAFGQTPVYTNAVNTANSILPLIQAALSGQTNAPAAAARRVRVQGPQGETGTMDSSEPLPAGWKIIQ